MPYAAEGCISHDPIDGGVEITEAQYAEGLAAMLEGKRVSIVGGFHVAAVEAPGEPDPDPEPTPEQLERLLVTQFNEFLDSVAGQRRYDSRFTCALRAGFEGPFQAEGQVFAAWMDECNMIAYGVMADVKAGRRAVPSPAELLAMMPQIQWPPSPIPEGAV